MRSIPYIYISVLQASCTTICLWTGSHLHFLLSLGVIQLLLLLCWHIHLEELMKPTHSKEILIMHRFHAYFLNVMSPFFLSLTACLKPLMFSTSSAELLFLNHMLRVCEMTVATSWQSILSRLHDRIIFGCCGKHTHHRSRLWISCLSLKSRKRDQL